MRISFDLDDTLIRHPSRPEDTDQLCGEKLRVHTIPLLLELSRNRGHELWIYTTSNRSPFKLKWGFRFRGVPIQRVINSERHLQKANERNPPAIPSKNPSWFGIDLHIDDSPGVAVKATNLGFHALIVSPDNDDWHQIVLKEVSRQEKI